MTAKVLMSRVFSAPFVEAPSGNPHVHTTYLPFQKRRFVSVQAVFVKQPGVFINDGTGTPFK
jgi:hypothetical protein